MVLDAQPLEDEAGYGRLIELEGRTFLKLPRPSKDFLGTGILSTRFLYCMDGGKGGGGKTDHEGGKAGKRPALTGRSISM